MHTFKYGMIVGLTLTACDSNNGKSTSDDTAETHDTADTSSPTDPNSILTQTDDESQYSRTLWSYGIMEAQIDETSITGTLDYDEYWEGESPHCSTVLQIAGEPWDACDENSPGNDWCYTYTLSAIDPPTECGFEIEEMALNLTNESAFGFVAYTSEGVDTWGDPVSNQLDYGVISDNGSYWTSESDWTYTPPDINIDLGGIGIDIPLLYETCDQTLSIGLSELAVDVFADSGVVACDFWEPMSDIWTVTLAAGDTLAAAVNTNENSDVALSLVDQNGCLISDVYPDANCSGGGYCSSFEYNVPEDGTYSLIVYGDWCSGDSVAYEIGAAVQ